MKTLIVNAPSKHYPILIGDSFEGLCPAFEAAGLVGRKAVIVTDTTVETYYADAVLKMVSPAFSSVSVCAFPAGEESKTLETITLFYQHFFEHRLDRGAVVIALGGGVVGDMAGFAAATYLRGIPFVQVPTTLLSQVDSSVGGKTAVDFMNAKNLIGAFYQPEFVYINTRTLFTLPREQVVSGMGEVIKHGFLRDKNYLEFIAAHRAAIIALDPAVMQTLIHDSCKIKAEVVGLDEKEQGLRETLNLGHTFGHAVESLYEFRLPHGHCVALGLCAALYLSSLKGGISAADIESAAALLSSFGLPVSLGADGAFDADKIFAYMTADKKARNGKIRLVLLDRIGHAYSYKDASREELMAGIAYIGRKEDSE
ncbi:MAG: 3-dehydroquinate synthase [Clostridiales bacterium]|nr:3-dehydroquinate synthase [Clostridiales bacterium]